MTDYERIKREYDLSLLQKDRLMSKVYPVGSIYMSINEISPAALFGGTWTRIQNVFLLAASDTHPVGESRGEEQVTLKKEEMPFHNHEGIYFSHGEYHLTYGNALHPGEGSSAAVSVNGGAYFETGYTGGDKNHETVAHNNMPPYLAVYIWQRVA